MTRDLRVYGYTLSLHRENEDPNFGFGYKPEEEQEVLARQVRWNAHTADDCLIKGKCHTCAYVQGGGKYLVTRLGD